MKIIWNKVEIFMEVVIWRIKHINSYLPNERGLLMGEASKNSESRGVDECQKSKRLCGGCQLQSSSEAAMSQPVDAPHELGWIPDSVLMWRLTTEDFLA